MVPRIVDQRGPAGLAHQRTGDTQAGDRIARQVQLARAGATRTAERLTVGAPSAGAILGAGAVAVLQAARTLGRAGAGLACGLVTARRRRIDAEVFVVAIGEVVLSRVVVQHLVGVRRRYAERRPAAAVETARRPGTGVVADEPGAEVAEGDTGAGALRRDGRAGVAVAVAAVDVLMARRTDGSADIDPAARVRLRPERLLDGA